MTQNLRLLICIGQNPIYETKFSKNDVLITLILEYCLLIQTAQS